jgi:hypothetical protein
VAEPELPPGQALEPEPPPTPAVDPKVRKRADLQKHRAHVATKLQVLENELTALRETLLETVHRVKATRVELRAVDVSIDELD